MGQTILFPGIAWEAEPPERGPGPFGSRSIPNKPTLADARRRFFEGIWKGTTTCECCDRVGKVYKRKIHAQIAVSLVWLVKEHAKTKDYINVPKLAPRYVMSGREFDKLEMFGLAIRKPKDDDDTVRRESGCWMPTVRGIDFVHRKVEIPSYTLVYNQRVMEWSDEQVDIVQSLGKHWNYQELMSAPASEWKKNK